MLTILKRQKALNCQTSCCGGHGGCSWAWCFPTYGANTISSTNIRELAIAIFVFGRWPICKVSCTQAHACWPASFNIWLHRWSTRPSRPIIPRIFYILLRQTIWKFINNSSCPWEWMLSHERERSPYPGMHFDCILPSQLLVLRMQHLHFLPAVLLLFPFGECQCHMLRCTTPIRPKHPTHSPLESKARKW